MPAEELRIGNRTAYFRKSILTPGFSSDRVLARDHFQFATLWLRQKCPDALPFWDQSAAYFKASQQLPPQSAPLTLYYCFLNAAKALLLVKNVPFKDSHGVSGQFQASKRALANEKIALKSAGIVAAMSQYLGETEQDVEHTLRDILSNLVFIHRAYRFTFRSHPELFIPLRNVVYRLNAKTHYVYVSATIEGRYADGRTLKTLPSQFEQDLGFKDQFVIRPKNSIKWYASKASKAEQAAALKRLHEYHRKMRSHLVYISAAPDLWYLKRNVANTKRISRYSMTLIMAAMHRLSELSRYDPEGLIQYLDGKENWLLNEFIELAPAQFLDELVCEMTSLEFGLPGIRPRSS